MKKKIAMTALWLAALVCCLLLADKWMRRDDTDRKYGAFFEDQQGFDVLFMGTSRVLDAVSPMELWRDFGVTSYNMGNNSEPLEATYHVLKYAMGVHKPKVVVVDVFYMDHAIDEYWAFPYRHMFLDAVPFGREKVELVKATLPEDQWLEFLMPFSLYHGRWDEILSGSVERMVECERFMMGGEFRPTRKPRDDYGFTDEMIAHEAPGAQALRDIAALCRENGVELVFVALPGHAAEETQMYINSAAPVAEALGVPFVNMIPMGVIDRQTDCYDYEGHLNPDGASKATAYLGEYLTANYALEDKRESAAHAYWGENLKKYEAHRAAVWTR